MVLFLLLWHLISSSLPVNVSLQPHWPLWCPQHVAHALSQNLAFAHFYWKCSSPLICEPGPLTPFRYKYEPLIKDITGYASVILLPTFSPLTIRQSLLIFFPLLPLINYQYLTRYICCLFLLLISVSGLTFLRAWQGVSLCCSLCLDSCLDHHINMMPNEMLNKY